jgi:pimeloyl-ACP methyl ester carboxylesterase
MDTWIFLRGLTRETAHWGGFIADFQKAMPASQVISLDLPGNGRLNAMPSPLSIAAMVSYCRAELKRRGEKPPFYLLAMSLGAMVATEWAYQAPAELAGCVLINTSLRPFSPFYRRLQPHNYLPLSRLALPGSGATDWERTVLQLTSNQPAAHDDVIAEWVAARMQRPVSANNALRQLIAAARYRVQIEPPMTRVLLLASERDRLVDARCSRAISGHWGCPLELHPSAGHDIPLDDPHWVIRQVLQWLGKNSESSTRQF